MLNFNNRFLNKTDLAKCREVVEGKKELYRDAKLFDKLFDFLVSTKQLNWEQQNSLDQPVMATVLEILERDLPKVQ